MQATDVQIAICGSAGDGTIAAGDILKRTMALMGYKVIAFDVYPAEIRGFGKCIARVRFSSEQAYSLKHKSDVLLSLNDAHAIPHAGEVRDYGALIYDSAPIARVAEGGHMSAHVRPAQVPYGVAFRQISERSTGDARARNIAAVGYLAGLLGLPRTEFHRTIATKFGGKSQTVIDQSVKAFEAGYAQGHDTFRLDDVKIAPPLHGADGARAVMMTGNGATVRGLLEAGIDTYFGYPITPATSIMERLATEMPKRGGKMLQTEDEISAIAATIGAGYAGARAATATSGPGLALMAEMLGLGVMAEVPSVVIVSQRGGPSTGLPTKTEQSDLNMAVYGGSGDAQRIVLAPTNVEGCYRCAGKAFEMAEDYQTPVIVLLDLYLSNRYETVVPPKTNPFKPKAVPVVDGTGPFKRFAPTPSHISPRAIPGQKGGVHTVTGLEHNELGRPSDLPSMHESMSAKRHLKLDAALKHPDFTVSKRFGDTGKVSVGLLGWGSTFGEILEAMYGAHAEGITCSAMKVVMLSPLPTAEIAAFFDDCDVVIIPELNYEGQFAALVCGAIGRSAVRLTRATGAPFEVAEILDAVRKHSKSTGGDAGPARQAAE
jgi:2-oxoglutarate ferredoxin oxidoreductase subunit alpha